MSLSKEILSQYLTEAGLVVEGNETAAELQEAYHNLRQAGRPSIVKEEAK